MRAGLSDQALAADLARCHLMALPSIAEGFGLTIMEAMACGVPVICTHNTGGADLITDGQDGFVASIRDVSAIIQIIERGMTDREKLYEIGQNGRALVERRPWASYRESFAAAYRSLLP